MIDAINIHILLQGLMFHNCIIQKMVLIGKRIWVESITFVFQLLNFITMLAIHILEGTIDVFLTLL